MSSGIFPTRPTAQDVPNELSGSASGGGAQEELARLRERLDSAKNCGDTPEVQDVADELAALAERLAADAGRYQFLRDNPGFQIEFTGELTLDQHIDAAMRGSGGGE